MPTLHTPPPPLLSLPHTCTCAHAQARSKRPASQVLQAVADAAGVPKMRLVQDISSIIVKTVRGAVYVCVALRMCAKLRLVHCKPPLSR